MLQVLQVLWRRSPAEGELPGARRTERRAAALDANSGGTLRNGACRMHVSFILQPSLTAFRLGGQAHIDRFVTVIFQVSTWRS